MPRPTDVPARTLWWQAVAVRLWAAVAVVVLLAAGWMVVGRFIAALVGPVAVAAIVTYLADPAVAAVTRRTRLTRGAATLMVAFTAATAAAAVVRAAAPVVVRQALKLADAAPAIGRHATRELQDTADRLGLQVDIPTARLDAGAAETVIGGVLGAVTSTTSVVVLALTGVLTGLYVVADLPRLQRTGRDAVVAAVGPDRAAAVSYVLARMSGTIGSWLRGQAAIAAIVGTMSAATLAVVGVPLWALLGVLAATLNVVPLIGPITTAVVAAVVAVTVGDGAGQAATAVVGLLVVQQVDAHLVTPRVMARAISVPAAVLLPVMAAAATAWGFAGLVLAVPVVGTVAAGLRAARDVHAGVDDVPCWTVADDPDGLTG